MLAPLSSGLSLELGKYKSNFGHKAFNILITLPTIFFLFKETTQVSLEDIDLLFGERALGTLPDDLHKESQGVTQLAIREPTM